MEIHQFRVVLRAADFDRTCRFYGETLGLPRQRSWDREDRRGAAYMAGGGLVEVLGRPRSDTSTERDERFDYQGPDHKLTLTLQVESVEKAYDELALREPNIPGGLRHDVDGSIRFVTHDPDGVRLVFVQTGTADG